MKRLLVSPAHIQVALVACETPSDARDFGTLVHLLVLQPHLVSREHAVFPGVAERKSVLDEFASSHSGKLVVDEPNFAAGRRVAQRVMDTLYKDRPLQEFVEESIPKATIYFTEPFAGLRMRIRFNAMHPEISFDLRTT